MPRLRDKSQKSRELGLELSSLGIPHQEASQPWFGTCLIDSCTSPFRSDFIHQTLWRLWVLPWKNTTHSSVALQNGILIRTLNVFFFNRYEFYASFSPPLSLDSPIPRMEDAAFQKKSLPEIYKLKEKKSSALEASAFICFRPSFTLNLPSHLHISRRRWKTWIMLRALFEDGNPARGLSFTIIFRIFKERPPKHSKLDMLHFVFFRRILLYLYSCPCPILSCWVAHTRYPKKRKSSRKSSRKSKGESSSQKGCWSWGSGGAGEWRWWVVGWGRGIWRRRSMGCSVIPFFRFIGVSSQSLLVATRFDCKIQKS